MFNGVIDFKEVALFLGPSLLLMSSVSGYSQGLSLPQESNAHEVVFSRDLGSGFSIKDTYVDKKLRFRNEVYNDGAASFRKTQISENKISIESPGEKVEMDLDPTSSKYSIKVFKLSPSSHKYEVTRTSEVEGLQPVDKRAHCGAIVRNTLESPNSSSNYLFFRSDFEQYFNIDLKSCQESIKGNIHRALERGVKCLNSLNTPRTRLYMAKIDSLLVNSDPIKVRCKIKKMPPDNFADATLPGTPEYPTIRFGMEAESAASEDIQSTFFHEFFHLLDPEYFHAAADKPDVVIGCETCCFPEAKVGYLVRTQEAREQQCEVCSGKTRDVSASYSAGMLKVAQNKSTVETYSKALLDSLSKESPKAQILSQLKTDESFLRRIKQSTSYQKYIESREIPEDFKNALRMVKISDAPPDVSVGHSQEYQSLCKSKGANNDCTCKSGVRINPWAGSCI